MCERTREVSRPRPGRAVAFISQHACVDRVPGDGRRVRALALAHDVDARPAGPDLELVGGRRAEGVAGADQHAPALLLELVGGAVKAFIGTGVIGYASIYLPF